MNMLTEISLEKAVSILQDCVNAEEKTENISILEAEGRITSQCVSSSIDSPPFDKSPLDGYALISDDTKNASKNSPVNLKVIGKLCAGDYTDITLNRGETMRIMTGAMIPKGADCIIRQELTDYGEDTVNIYKSLQPFENYCFKGEDFKKGDILIKKDEKLSYVDIGVLASTGRTYVSVYTKPRVAVLVTGDELIYPGEPLLKGKIYNSNLYLIASRLKSLSINPIYIQQVGDDCRELEQKLIESASIADLVITTGGVSVGQKDIIHDVLTNIGADFKFWRINIKPGTPAMFSIFNNTPILSLSGNPFAAVTTFELLARPILAKLSHDTSLMTTETTALMENDFPKKSTNIRFIRARLKDNKVTIPENKHSSGILASMKHCNCLVEIEAGNNGLKKGDCVKVIIL